MVNLIDAPGPITVDVPLPLTLQDGFWQRALWIDLNGVQQGAVVGQGTMIDGIYYDEADWPETMQILASLGIRLVGGGASPSAFARPQAVGFCTLLV